MLNVTKLVFIGDSFYFSSGTMMSSLYRQTVTGWERYDWGFVSRDLSQGFPVTITPASKAELLVFEKFLEEVIRIKNI